MGSWKKVRLIALPIIDTANPSLVRTPIGAAQLKR